MDERIKKLPDSELEVMQAVWDCVPPVSRGEIEQKLADSYPIAQTTLLTLLSRLTEKGFLTVDKAGRGKSYTPVISRQEYLAAQGNRFFKKLCGGNLATFAAALCDSGVSKEDLVELRSLLERGEL